MFQPSAVILKKYAQLLVNYALHSGQGVKPLEVVLITGPDTAKPMLMEVYRAVMREGAHPIVRMSIDGMEKDFFDLANPDQLNFFPRKMERQLVNTIDHAIHILAENDPLLLRAVDPRKIIQQRNVRQATRKWLIDKENKGKFTWTLALYGTPGMAKQAGLTLADYWDQIIKGCYLDESDPIATWQRIGREQARLISELNQLKIEAVHVEGDSVDLHLDIGKERAWRGGTGRNIPSFEIFTSPNWRGTSGTIRFNQPLFRYGNLIRDIYLRFVDGVVVEARAKEGDPLLQEMLRTKNADKLGEFSLTDGRMSRITHFMANTLFDENIGGPEGNMHVALGQAYHDCFKGDIAAMKRADWMRMGYNESAEHTDIITTERRKVTAFFGKGQRRVIYADGRFTI